MCYCNGTLHKLTKVEAFVKSVTGNVRQLYIIIQIETMGRTHIRVRADTPSWVNRRSNPAALSLDPHDNSKVVRWWCRVSGGQKSTIQLYSKNIMI